MQSRQKGLIFLFLAALLWGWSGFLARKIFDQGAGIFTYALGTNFATFSFVFIFCYKKINFRISKSDFKKIFLLSLAGATTLVTIIAAFKYTRIANAEFLHYTMPVFVVVLAAALLKEKLTKLKVLFSFIAIIGIFLVFSEQLNFQGARLGNSLALVSAISYAFAIIITRKIKHLGAYTIAFWQILLNAIFLLPLAVIFFSGLSGVAAFYIFLNGAVLGALALLLYYQGLVMVEASIASIILLFEAVSASIIAWLFLGENLTALNILGGLLILGSSAGLFLKMKEA